MAGTDKRSGMSVSEQSLAFCLLHLRKGVELKEVAAMVKEKFEDRELELAIDYLRMQHRLTTAHRGKRNDY